MRGSVVFVHGLWLTGGESFLLRRRLAAAGYRLRAFPYSSLGESMPQVTARCARFARQLGATIPGPVHFVGHSLGGLVIYRMFEQGLFDDGDESRASRVVFLGTPALASGVAERLGSTSTGRLLLGRAGAAELIKAQQRHWRFAAELGVISGNLPYGLGRVLLRFEDDNDGTVAVAETRLPGANAHCVLPVTHSQLPFSADVAREVIAFFETGAFTRAAAAGP